MNPLVSEMLGVSARNDLEVTFLEDLLNDDCKCESSHQNSTCTYEVTTLVTATCCGKSWRICEGSARYTRTYTLAKLCGQCRSELVADCWEIRPI